MSTATISTAITGVHPYADKFPMLPEPELQELAESIVQNGLRQPIVLTEDGLILDGRNRAKACEMAGITPDITVYDGDDLAEYVIDCNVTRRNMSTGARAMATALVLVEDDPEVRNNGRWQRGSIDMGTSSHSDYETFRKAFQWAGVVLDFTPNVAERVIAGETALKEAFREADAIRRSADAEKIRAKELEKQRRQEEEAEANRQADAKCELAEAGAGHYLAMIEDGMKPTSALAAWREDTRKERERAEGKRRAEQQQARNFCDLLARLTDFTHDNQRSWTRDCIANHGDALPEHYRALHNPSTIRELGQALQTYAEELES